MSNDSAYNKALALLATRDHARRELAVKLTKAGFAEDAINAALAQLATQGLLDDAHFALTYSISRARRGFGPVRIGQELAERGVDPACIEVALADPDLDWCELAESVWFKKFAGLQPTDLKEKAKQVQFLQYRGFASEHFSALFKHAGVDIAHHE